jgi:hypothetical protein
MKYRVTIFLMILLSAVNMCNPASVDVPDPLCNGIHPVKNGVICHGAKFLEPSLYCSEANCHGSNFRGGNTGAPSCYACHGPYWEVRALHTKTIYGFRHHRDVCTSADFIVTCGDLYCHEPALTGSNKYMKSPGCNKCHAIPAASGENCYYGTHTKVIFHKKHHVDVCTSADFVATCGNSYCHGSMLTGTSGYRNVPGCSSCHGIPAADGSNCAISSTHTNDKEGRLHYSPCTTLSICSTDNCHGSDLKGGTIGLFKGGSCSRSGCHGNTPSSCDD